MLNRCLGVEVVLLLNHLRNLFDALDDHFELRFIKLCPTSKVHGIDFPELTFLFNRANACNVLIVVSVLRLVLDERKQVNRSWNLALSSVVQCGTLDDEANQLPILSLSEKEAIDDSLGLDNLLSLEAPLSVELFGSALFTRSEKIDVVRLDVVLCGSVLSLGLVVVTSESAAEGEGNDVDVVSQILDLRLLTILATE